MFLIKRKHEQPKGQGMVEFAITLPVVLLITFGLIEFGFLIFSYSAVNSASREAARYGIAVGTGEVSGQRYYDCTGIVNAGLRIGTWAGMDPGDFNIAYDSGPGTATKYSDCATLAALNGADSIEFGDRIVVSVSHQYRPLITYLGLNLNPFNMVSTSNRTIVKEARIMPGGLDGDVVITGPCYSLTTAHTGTGSNPAVTPISSIGCNIGQYTAGEILTFNANPGEGWFLMNWSGTDNNKLESLKNKLTMPASDRTVTAHYGNSVDSCFKLDTSIAGEGSGAIPTMSPEKSTNCNLGKYYQGAVVTLSASPDLDNRVAGWINSDNDSSVLATNTRTMPGSNITVSVIYEPIVIVCYSLSTTHSGTGTDPVPSASNCEGGTYVEGTIVNLNATPGVGQQVQSWSGSDDDTSTNTVNTVTMTSDKAVVVNYVPTPVLDPPTNVYIPNGPGEWKWLPPADEQCRQIDLRWSVNPSWSPEVPIYYEVFKGSTSYGTIAGTHWDSDWTMAINNQITLGVRAVFAGGLLSAISDVTYQCNSSNLVYISASIH